MDISISQIIIWLIVGSLAGSVTGALVKRKKEGYGRLRNMTIGMVGAVIGGGLFSLFKIDLGLGDWKVTGQDLVSALIGSFLLLIVIWLIGKRRAKPIEPAA